MVAPSGPIKKARMASAEASILPAKDWSSIRTEPEFEEAAMGCDGGEDTESDEKTAGPEQPATPKLEAHSVPPWRCEAFLLRKSAESSGPAARPNPAEADCGRPGRATFEA